MSDNISINRGFLTKLLKSNFSKIEKEIISLLIDTKEFSFNAQKISNKIGCKYKNNVSAAIKKLRQQNIIIVIEKPDSKLLKITDNVIDKSLITTPKEPTVTGPQVEKVWNHYMAKLGRDPNKYHLTKQRKLKIKLRIQDCGFETCINAINALANNKWCNGDNPSGKKYIDIDKHLFKSQERVEQLILDEEEDMSNKPNPAIPPKVDWSQFESPNAVPCPDHLRKLK